MAEGVLFNIAGTILSKLGSPALREIGLLWGLSDELKKLQATVSTIKAVLLDAEKLSRTSNQVKLWLDDLKDVVYDADDLVDDISTEALRRQLKASNVVTKEVRVFFSSSNRLAYGLQMAHKVKDVRAKLDLIAENRTKFRLNENVVEPTAIVRGDRDTHSSAPSVVIGRVGDKKKIMSLLFADCEENVAVVPIVGLGGMGKTTLAQTIYNDETVKRNFKLKAWVCVADFFDVKSIIEKIIACIDGKGPDRNLEMEVLKNQLNEKIKGKKYLFVLDDIWNEDRKEWIRLSDLIMGGAPGSRIVITTRSKLVAEITSTSQPHELKGLSKMESWDLFLKVAFKQGQAPTKEFETLGKEFAAKCGGLPLAIRTIGGMLYTKTKESEWRNLKAGELSKLDPENNIVETLKLSYNHLPSNLKHCFAYCSMFPKNFIFDVSTLINYWKAQGYVDSKNIGASCEDEGLNCLKYLVQGSFLQVERENKDGELVECRMHDFMHDLATSVAGDEVKLFVTNGNASGSGTTITGKTRHLFLHQVFGKVEWQHVAPLLQGKKARTLIVQARKNIGIAGEEWFTIFEELEYLRVLELPWGRFKKLPSSTGRLKHLRQLDLSGNSEIEILPDSITGLLNLQVLNLDYCRRLKKLPKDMMKNLVNLIHIGLEGCLELEEFPRGIGKLLTSLEVLTTFRLPKRRGEATGGLDELRELSRLRGSLQLLDLKYLKKGAWECEAANLKDKPHLVDLVLGWGNRRKVKDMHSEEKSLEALQPHANLRQLRLENYGGLRFPRWVSSLENLVEIQIKFCRNCKSLPCLDGLPSLQHLKVWRLWEMEYMIDNCGNTRGAGKSAFFPSLKTLDLGLCPKLKGWLRSTPTMEESLHYQLPCLYQLEILSCPNLKGWMPRLPSLDTVKLGGVRGLLEEILKLSDPLSASTSTSSSTLLSPLQPLGIGEQEYMGLLREGALQIFAPLKFLTIWEVEEMNLFEKINPELARRLWSLRSLGIKVSKKMKSIPKGIQHLTRLESLQIYDCYELVSLPAWMGNLTSLNLLEIRECPRLSERCGSNQGEDWPLISHIPDIRVNGTWVQLNGRYQL